MQYIRDLADLDRNDIAVAGGKGSSLGELMNMSAPVPPGFCVTTGAYDEFMESSGLAVEARAAFASVDSDDPAQIEQASKAIQHRITSTAMPEPIAREIEQAYVALGPRRVGVAVRSSATAEDLPEASFAGQHESYLNVVGDRDVIDAVKRCWASLWEARAILYRAQHGFGDLGVSMAVVVQRMLSPTVSGVLYTIDPTIGDDKHLVVHASYGLGESIVAGKVTPDVYRVDKASLTIKSRSASNKETMTVASPQGGTTDEKVSGERAAALSLADDELMTLAELAKKVEGHFGTPLDIEWSIADGQVWLLQARPLTAVGRPDGAVTWDNPAPGAKWLRNWRVGEWLADPVTPLFSTLLMPVLVAGREEQGFNHLGWDAPKAFAMPEPWYCIVNGYFFTRADPPFRPGAIDVAARSQFLTDRGKWYEEWQRTHLPAYLERLAGFQSIDLAAASSEAIMELLDDLCRDAGEWWYLQAPIGYGFEVMFFQRFYDEHFEGKDSPHYTLFFSGYDSHLLRGQRTLHALAQDLRGDRPLRSLIEERKDDAAMAGLAASAEGTRFLSKLNAYWEEFGHQIFSFDLFVPTLAEQPGATLQVLRSYLAEPPSDPAEVLAEQVTKREEAVAYAMKAIGDWPENDAETFRRLLTWHQLCAAIREDIVFHFQKLWPLMRAGVLELGRRLESKGALDSADLVFFLTKSEVWHAAGESKPGDLTSKARERRDLWERQRQLSPPDRIPPPQHEAWESMSAVMVKPGLQRRDDGRVLVGHGASPGKVTARARVMRSASDFSGLKRGEVLVTVAASPAWTPLFSLASAVVTEIGGGATHSSMVAREYGIPAVMGTGVATQEIADGQMITVDGTSGVVYLDVTDVTQRAK